VALAVTALVVALGAALMASVGTGSHTLPIQGARQASDARIEAMIGELRNAVAVTGISPTQVSATISTKGLVTG
jgi:hypothetical protein